MMLIRVGNLSGISDPVTNTRISDKMIVRKFEFYVQVFRNDYDPIGLWAERQGVLPVNLYNVNNIFPCMGLYDDNGQVKDGITFIWQDALP